LKKHLLVLAGLFALLASSTQLARAQDSPPAQDPEARKARTPDEVVALLDSKLSLADDQKAKVTPIIADRQEKIRELADSSGRRMRKGRQMKSIYEETDQRIMALLNDDQTQKYKEMQKQMRDNAKQRMHDRTSSDQSQ
jgi:periplasmic protein CpxP/Spy